MKIIGENLGEKEVEYKLLAEYQFFNDERQEIVKKLEQFYLKLVEESKKIDIVPFPQKDGKVIINPGMVNHRCSKDLASLDAISRYGVLASEWFGEIESEREGVFCSFVDKIHEVDNLDESKQESANSLNKKRLKSYDNNIILFFDSSNPVMQKLLHLDYFEYEKVKQLNPEKLTDIYSQEEIEMFDTIIEPYSPGGSDHHIKDMLPYCDWSAIPGGIPSALVNGICIKNNSYDKESIEYIANLFPKATIFNGDLEIVYMPEREEKNNEFLQSIKYSEEEVIENIQNQEYLKDIQLQAPKREIPSIGE